MRRRAGILMLAGAAGVIVVGCADRASPPAASPSGGALDGAPSIVGTITAIEGGRVRVEENPAERSGSEKAIVRLTSETVVHGPGGARWPADSLRVGQRARVWFVGPVAESYPVQAGAGRIAVD